MFEKKTVHYKRECEAFLEKKTTACSLAMYEINSQHFFCRTLTLNDLASRLIKLVRGEPHLDKN